MTTNFYFSGEKPKNNHSSQDNVSKKNVMFSQTPANTFNLSERIFERDRYGNGCEVFVEQIAEDVKEFVQLLKEVGHSKCLRNGTIPINAFYDLIDKLAGNKLVEETKK